MTSWRYRGAVVGVFVSILMGACSSSSTPAAGGTQAGPLAVRTSASCGNLPILGDFSGAKGPVPDDCKSCLDANCCDAAAACAADPGCSAYRECLVATSCGPGDFCGCDALVGASAQLSSALITCRNNSCDACFDLSCAGQPWPTLSAPSIAVHLTMTSFTAQSPLSGVLAKVCSLGDHDCAMPLDMQTTAADGTADLTMPSGPGGYGGYFDFSSPDIAPTTNEIHFVDLVAALQNETAPLARLGSSTLDANTWGLLRSSYNLPTDPGMRSRLNLQAVSCGGSTLAGVTLSSSSADADTVFGYVVKGVPSMTATETDASGLAGWENHPAGPTTITITKTSTGQKLLTYDHFVRGGVISSGGLPPGP